MISSMPSLSPAAAPQSAGFAVDRLIGEGKRLPRSEEGLPAARGGDPNELRKTVDAFVGEVFFGQMLESMRKTVGKPAYFHGGRGEEVFTERLDQVLSEEMTKASAGQFSGPMFQLFALNRT